MTTHRDTMHIPWAYSLVGAKRLPVSGRRHPLEKESTRYLLTGAMVAISVGLAAFLFWQWLLHREPDDMGANAPQIVRYTELGVPPSIDRPKTDQVSVAQQVAMAAPPQIAIPEPVPDDMVDPNQTIMTVAEVNSALQAATNADLGDLSGIQVEGGMDQQQQTEVFKQSVNVLPVRLKMDKPRYPDMARMAGIEGTVTVQVLVGKDGRVTKTKVIDGPVPLHEAAMEAAKTALFQPATTDGRPVAVWVAMPIKFTLR